MRAHVLVLWLFSAAAAAAADKPRYAPPPAWVVPALAPVELHASTTAAAKTLLLDEQFRLSPQGDDAYFERVARIQTPLGLDAEGTISLPWDPDTQTLTIHKLLIRRGGATIDVLASGQSFIVLRRGAAIAPFLAR